MKAGKLSHSRRKINSRDIALLINANKLYTEPSVDRVQKDKVKRKNDE